MPRPADMRSAARPSATSRRLWIVAAVALVFALRGTAEPVSGRDFTTRQLYRVERGTVSHAVHAVGTLAAPVASLSPRAAGHVAEVLVQPGDAVQAGQPLLTLETAALQAAVARAEADLRAAEARLALAAAPAPPEETAAAEARVRAAQARLADLLDAAATDTAAPARARLLAAHA